VNRGADGAIDLGNWRLAPYNRWAFQHVREIVPSANIAADSRQAWPPPRALQDVLSLKLLDFFEQSCTDAFMVLKRGAIVAEWFRTAEITRHPHIVFSVSKSMTAMLIGVLGGQGLLDPDSPVTGYIPEAKGSAYGDCTVRHVLDMVVSLDFSEAYLDPDGSFARYREATGWNPRRPEFKLHLHEFLLSLTKAAHPHGERFHYRSPNSDLLGWIVERVTNRPFAEVFSELIWQPMGAGHDAYITVDGIGAPRSAGGICCHIEDLARFGEMMRLGGVTPDDRQVVPKAWIEDIRKNGDVEAWKRGDMLNFAAACAYRSQWYNLLDETEALLAVGIHGQWIYVDHATEITIVKQSSQPLPVDEGLDRKHLAVFADIAKSF
jgi:hypothetical protein